MRDEGADSVLVQLAALAARVAGVSAAQIEIGRTRAVHGDPALLDTGGRFRAVHDIRLRDATIGRVTLVADEARGPLSPTQQAGIAEIAGIAASVHERERRSAQLNVVTTRAARADLILQLVSEASSCAEALTSLLEELCRHHDAVVGRIWRLMPDGLMHEVSRYNGEELAATSYYHKPPSAPVRAGNSRTAEAIRRNQAEAFLYSQVDRPEQWVLLPNAIESGLASQISFPFWVQEERFGIALAFTTERADLDAILADIASLANTIRPALFRKVTEEQIRHLAHHDDLTQLSNRTAFNERLQMAVDAAGETGMTLLYMDLDGFKQVNDTRGHQVGDQVLAEVAARLRASVRAGDTVARIGGDEFAVIRPTAETPCGGIALAERLLERLSEPFVIDGQRLVIGVSIGIARFPTDGATPGELLRSADAALYEAKAAGRNTYRVFDAVLGAAQHVRMLIEQDLSGAIGDRGFRLAFQPICDARSLRVYGLEALLRWNHPERGDLPPELFVPIAEASGLILPLGRWALETACAEAVAWPTDVCVSVNVSPLQFRQHGVTAEIAAVLRETGLPARRLELEVTEGLLLDNSAEVMRTMHELKDMGVRITLDDFGTAYASLSSLRRFPFDRLKLDRSFIHDMCDDGGTLAIVQAVLSLSERLGVEVVAEGVETHRELDMLRRLGCKMVQGFLTGRPMPAGDVRGLVRRGQMVSVAAA